jgi:hypothetical protein
MLILLTIEEDLVDVIVVVVIYVAYMRGLYYSDWLLLRLLVCGPQVCLRLNDGRGVILLERWSILLKRLILAQDTMTHRKRTNCHVANGTSSGCGGSSHTEGREGLVVRR